MGFKFSYLCDLLANLDGNRILKASSAARTNNPDIRTVSNWFMNYAKRVHDKDTDLLAFLSCLFPEKRTDRVYQLQHASLVKMIARCLLLGTSRQGELNRWQQSGGDDLGQCVENVMQQAENHILPGQEVTVEEIDEVLNKIASRCRFSGPRVRRQHTAVDVDESLGKLYRRLSARDAKWLTRMILKSYYPVTLPVNYVLKNVHFLLPHLLLFQDSFEAAVNLLMSTPLRQFPPRPQPDVAEILSEKALEHLAPRVGIKIGRPDFYKARSIRHCYNMINRRRMSLERKYDGEYCQIHIDLSNPQDCIKIFSKSGKDSTADRAGIHQTIKKTLRIGETGCKVSRCCILEGELLVWSDREEKILEFHKLRKFLSRSGTFIGTNYDSQPKPYEHLMIMFFDILLLDDNIVLIQPHRKRRLLLKDIINVITGHVGISEQEVIDFSRHEAQGRLQMCFAKSIAERWEGYVLKACDEPYFAILSPGTNDHFCRWIKLKKDYIPGLGDTADFALIGGRYVSSDAAASGYIKNLSWTHFYIGCLENKQAIMQFNARPRFRVVDAIGRHSMSAKDMKLLNEQGKFCECDADSNTAFDVQNIHSNLPDMDVAFKTPFVVELLGSGFDKPSNAQYFTLRFPRILKIHSDRTYEEAVSFTELQNLAEKARSVPEEESQEDALWLEKINRANGKSEYIIDDSQSSGLSDPSSYASVGSSQSAQEAIGSDVRRSSTEFAASTTAQDIAAVPMQSSHTPDNCELHAKRRASLSDQLLHAVQQCKKLKAVTASTTIAGEISIFTDPDQNTSPTQEIVDTTNRPFKQLDNLAETRPVGDDNGEGKTTSAGGRVIDDTVQARKINLQSPLVTLPIYCGEFFFRHKARCMERIFRGHAREFTFAPCRFVKSLALYATRFGIRNSNPQAAADEIALGIVLIDPKAHPTDLAKDILEVGNEVVSTQSSGSPNLPSKGKIFFLDFHILSCATGIEDKHWVLRSRWKQVCQACHATITWGFPPPSNPQLRRRIERHRLALSQDEGIPSSDISIYTSFDQKELEILGEFESLQPLIHISGTQFENTEL